MPSYLVDSGDLTNIADAIRNVAGLTSETKLAFPTAFVDTISFSSIANIDAIAEGKFQPGLSSMLFGSRASFIGSSVFCLLPVTSVSFPSVTRIEEYAFYGCGNLNSVSFPMASFIGQYAFLNCNSLSEITMPNANYIGSHAIQSCKTLYQAMFPNASYIGDYAFQYCINLSSAMFSLVSYVGNYAFCNCTSLSTIFFPSATFLGANAFSGCTYLNAASFPKVTDVPEQCFAGCTSLTSLWFDNLQFIAGLSTFYRCTKLTALFLHTSSMVQLTGEASSMFRSTPLYNYSAATGVFGNIYVP